MNTWRVEAFGREFVIQRTRGRIARGGSDLAQRAQWIMESWARTAHGSARRGLMEMAAAVGIDVAHVRTADHVWLARAVADAIRRGQLRMEEDHGRRRLHMHRVEQPEEPVSRGPETEDTTWIAIELVDQDGDPVGYQRYRIELPSGAVREGSLNAQGTARIDGIDPGTCKVSFPEIDGADWRAA